MYEHIKKMCEEALKSKSYGRDPVVQLWHAFSCALLDLTGEAIREYEEIQSYREVQLACTAGLLHAHQKAAAPDQQIIDELEAQLVLHEMTCGEQEYWVTALLYWHAGDIVKSREFVGKALEKREDYANALVLRGWLEVEATARGMPSHSDRALQSFDAVLSGSNDRADKDVEALLGKARLYELRGKHDEALECLNQGVVLFSSFVPVHAEKARLLFSVGDYEQANELAENLLLNDPRCIPALQLVALYRQVRGGRQGESPVPNVQMLGEVLLQTEARHPSLLVETLRPFIFASARNTTLLKHCKAILGRATAKQHTAAYFNACGACAFLLGDTAAAMAHYRKASEVDQADLDALYGAIQCQIRLGQLEDAEQQLEFLTEIQISLGQNPHLSYLSALINIRRNLDRDTALVALHGALEQQLGFLATSPPVTPALYATMNPAFVADVVTEILACSVSQPIGQDQAIPSDIRACVEALEAVSRYAPALPDCQILLARCHYLTARWTEAQKILTDLFSIDPSIPEGHILMAEILFEQQEYQQALSSLEAALSYSFHVRETPAFNLIKAKIHQRRGEWVLAKEVLTDAMALLKSKQPTELSVTLSERASVYVELAKVHSQLKEWDDSSRVMREAHSLFDGSPEELVVTLAEADIALARGDTEASIARLKAVPRESPYYSSTVLKLADIYLVKRNNSREYIKALQDLCEHTPSIRNYTLLGEGHLRIQQPDEAIASFEAALALNPEDPALANRIGKALITTHDYERAINYYETAVNAAPHRFQLRKELAQLYLRMRRFEEAERTLQQAPELQEASSGTGSLDAMIACVQNSLILSEVYVGQDQSQRAVEILQRAHHTQEAILRRAKNTQPELYKKQRPIASQLCFKIAAHYHQMPNLDSATQYYNEALRFDQGNEKALLALARLALGRGAHDICEEKCETLLQINAGNEEVLQMLADIKFQKRRYEDATIRFKNLLDHRPTHYSALHKLISLLWRAGRADEIPHHIQRAERSSSHAVHHSGLHFCKGLHAKCCYAFHDALEEFNVIRRDPEWGERALQQMITIYLTPELDQSWDDQGKQESIDNSESINAAQKLAEELQAYGAKPIYRVYQCYATMATGRRPDIEQAQRTLLEICRADREFVPGLLALAHSFMLVNQKPKARNHLKMIAKMHPTPNDVEEFERAWLMLADIYISSRKYDLAQDLCKRCIDMNKSCARAHEYQGIIYEKEQAYRDAADHYERAWRLQKETSPSIGYKLAFNYLKAKRFVDAIDVCHKVLALYPHYPLKHDILDRARVSLRLRSEPV